MNKKKSGLGQSKYISYFSDDNHIKTFWNLHLSYGSTTIAKKETTEFLTEKKVKGKLFGN